jgi:predicted nucleotidyltransferase
MNTSEESTLNSDEPKASKLTQLNSGLLMLTIKKEVEQPEYTAIDRQTFEHDVLQRRHSYAGEIQRVLNELKLTTELLQEVDAQKQIRDKVHEPEEVINYYSGIYFGLVHQLKDKLLRLILHMLDEGPWSKPYDEPDTVKVSKILNKHAEALGRIGILDSIEKWQEGSDGAIAIVLKRRTQHHHFRSRLQLAKEFQDIQTSRLMLAPAAVDHLSEYGKRTMGKMYADSLRKLKENTVQKQQDTIAAIEANLEVVATGLINYFNIPTSPIEHAKIASQYMELLASQRVKNQASKDKIQPEFQSLIDSMLEMSKKNLDGMVVSIYLVGSIGRGEFVPGSSDVNFIVVSTKISDSFNFDKMLDVMVLSEADFLSDAHIKERFICWSDGILLGGKKFKFDSSDFPKPGMGLCLLLNDGFQDRLTTIRDEVVALESPTAEVLRRYTLVAVKIMLDYDFGIAMSNQPLYTASRIGKLEHTKTAFPSQVRTLTLQQLYSGGAIRQTDFPMFIGTYIDNTKSSYAHIHKVMSEFPRDR